MKISWVVDPLSPLLQNLGHNFFLFKIEFFPLNGELFVFVTNGKVFFILNYKLR